MLRARSLFAFILGTVCACGSASVHRAAVHDLTPAKPRTVSEVRAQERMPEVRGAETVSGALGRALEDLEQVQLRFETDSYALAPESREGLEGAARTLRRYPKLDVFVVGRTDERGHAKYNTSLAYRRANAVAAVLVGLGVPRGQLIVVARGEEQPRPLGHDHAAWAANRRVEVAVLRGDTRLLPAPGVLHPTRRGDSSATK